VQAVTGTGPRYDDTSAGPRWTYGLTSRPLGSAQVPAGWIIGSDRPHPRYRFGTVDYAAPVPPEQAERFELELVRAPAEPGRGGSER
jgi:hypothetical protein